MAKFSARFLVMFCFLMNLAMAASGTQSNQAFNTAVPDPIVPDLNLSNNGAITRKQAAIWSGIMIAIISIGAVYALYGIDDVKNRDTILYAKFLANLKDR